MAGMEHELEDLMRYFIAKDIRIMDNIYYKTAKKHSFKWGYPLVTMKTLKRRKKKKVIISTTMDRERRATKFVAVTNKFKTAFKNINNRGLD
eukprot:175880_1